MLLTEEQKKERSNPWLWTEVEITSPKPRFWDNGFFVWLVFFFSSGRLEPRKHRTSCLLGSKSVRWGSIHFQKVTSKKKSPFFSLMSPAAYTCALTLTPQTVLNPHTISQAACLLLLASPLLSWLRRSIHERVLHTASQWNSPKELPAHPIFHELGPDTPARGKTMSEPLPALAAGLVHVTELLPATLRHSTPYFSGHQTNRPLNAFSAGCG